MKIVKTLLIAICTLFCISTFAIAGKTGPVKIIIGSGGEGGTYYPIIEQFSQFCSDDEVMIEHYFNEKNESVGGTINNRRNLLTNKIMAGIMQLDAAHLEKMKNKAMNRVLALVPLHEEQLTFIVPLQTKVMVQKEKKNWMGKVTPAKFKIAINNIEYVSQLKGMNIAAWGGSVISAKIVKEIGGVNFNIVKVDGKDQALNMLANGQVQAILAVVGSPAKWIENLPSRTYKLLSIMDITREKLKKIYGISSISYDNMGTTGQSVEAFGVDSVLFTRTYRTPKMLNALGKIQSCLKSKIYEIQDTPGTHAIWQSIDPNKKVKWDNVFTPR